MAYHLHLERKGEDDTIHGLGDTFFPEVRRLNIQKGEIMSAFQH